MNGRERIIGLLKREKIDRVPIFPKISYATSRAVDNMSIRDYMTSPENMARAIIACADKYGYDAVGITTDIGNEGMALGSEYVRPENATGKLVKHLLDEVTETDKIVVKSPYETEPTKTILAATKLVRERAGDRLFVTAWCNGPLNVASQLIPMQEVLYAMLDEPEELHKLLKICADYSANYARELIKSGAGGVSFGHAMASCSVISPAFYEEFALPYERQIIDAIHSEGGVAITHICGNITPVVSKIATNGSDIIDFDHGCDFIELSKCASQIFRGNIDPSLLKNGTADEVFEATKKLVLEAKDSKRFILGIGCEVDPDTPTENFEAYIRAGKQFGEY